MPIALSSVWSLSVDGSEPMIEFIQGIKSFERTAGAQTKDPRIQSRGEWTESLSIFTTVLGEAGALTGDGLLASGSTDLATKQSTDVEWVFVLGLKDAVNLRDGLPRALDELLERGWTCGAIHDDTGGLHIVHRDEATWYWRQTGDVIVASRSERMLDLVGDWHPDQGAGGDETTLHRALRNIPTDSPFLFMLDPIRYRHHVAPSSAQASLGGPPPWHELLTLDLRSDFRFAAAVQFREDGLMLHTNLGVWTALSELAATALDTLETRMIDNLLPECRSAYGTMCAALEASPLCANFLPGRAPVVARACARLKAKGLLKSEEAAEATDR